VVTNARDRVEITPLKAFNRKKKNSLNRVGPLSASAAMNRTYISELDLYNYFINVLLLSVPLLCIAWDRL